MTTIPPRERGQALAEVVRHETEQAVWMGVYYATYNTIISNRVKGVTPSTSPAKAFNAHLWEIT